MADGRYVIALRSEVAEVYFGTADEEDSFELQASHKNHGTKQVALQPGQTEVHLSFGDPARLEVVVTGYPGSALEGRILLALMDASDESGFGTMLQDGHLSSEGVQVFEAVEPGSYKLQMMLTERGGSRRSYGRGGTLLVQPITLVPGANTVSLPLPILYEVAVSHPEAKAGTRIQLSSGSDPFGHRQAATDAQGRAVFEDVPAGHYTLQSWDPHGQMEIDVPCGVVQFVARVMNALRVSVTDPGGALFAAGLRDGDLIVAVNGEEFESSEDYFHLYRKSADFKLTVLRSGQRIDLQIARLDLRDPTQLGGALAPSTH